jgi:hypothetical protein
MTGTGNYPQWTTPSITGSDIEVRRSEITH